MDENVGHDWHHQTRDNLALSAWSNEVLGTEIPIISTFRGMPAKYVQIGRPYGGIKNMQKPPNQVRSKLRSTLLTFIDPNQLVVSSMLGHHDSHFVKFSV